MSEKLARVRWEMGQALLPDHFVAMEDSFFTDSIYRFRLHGLPDVGIAALKINETLLPEGVFSINSMTAVMPSGILLNVPGNAVVSPFNLNVSGAVRVSVYMHLLKSPAGESEEEMEDHEEEAVARVVCQLVLSSDQNYPDALETLKMAEFEKDPDGNWKLSESFIPALLQVGTSPFLKRELNELVRFLEMFQYKIEQELVASYLSGDSLTTAKSCLKSVLRVRRFLANLLHKVHLHPYYLYETLKEFYTEVCFYKNTAPEHIIEVYEPSQLGKVFGNIFQPLKEQLQIVQAPSPYKSFELQDNVYRIKLPPKIREAGEVYFLIQKEHVTETFSVSELKLASVNRISMIHKLALQGIPLQKIDRPPFQHSFGPEVDFYMISQGEEWDHAIHDLNVAFYYRREFSGKQFYLYWRVK